MKKMVKIFLMNILIITQILVSGEVLKRSNSNETKSTRVSSRTNLVKSTRSDVPLTIAHQGVIKDDGIAISGNHDLSFSIYSIPTGGSVLWSETQSNITFSEGIFNVILGSVTPIDLDFDIQYYIGVSIDAGTEFSPRVQLTTSPYAFNSKKADIAEVASDIETDVAVTSLNGKQNDVSITAGDNIAIDNSGADIIISADLSGVITPDELVKVGAAGEAGYLSEDDFTSSTKRDDISKKSDTIDRLSKSNTKNSKGVISIKENAITESKLDVNNSAADGYALTYDSGTSKMMWKDVDTMVDGDNLGDHTATQNLQLGSHLLSYNEENKGIRIDEDGDVNFLGGGIVRVDSSRVTGVFVIKANYDGFGVNNAGRHGLTVFNAGENGVYLQSIAKDGVLVERVGAGLVGVIPSNLNNGLEVQGAEGHGVFIGKTFDDGIKIYSAGAPSETISNDLINGVEVNGAEGHGIYVGKADMTGVLVNKTSWSGVYVDSAGTGGVYVKHSNGSGLQVWNAGNTVANYSSGTSHGLEVNGVTGDGVFIGKAEGSGFRVIYAGEPSTSNYSFLSNGLEVRGAEGHGVFIGRADSSAIHIESTGSVGVQIESSSNDGIRIVSAGSPINISSSSTINGLEVGGAEDSGVLINRADETGIKIERVGAPSGYSVSSQKNGIEIQGVEGNGIFIGKTNWDGVVVIEAGNPTTSQHSGWKNGFEIQGAEGYGLFVGQADMDGIYINKANEDGIKVIQVGTGQTPLPSGFHNGLEIQASNGNGVYVGNVGTSGIEIEHSGADGIRIMEAGTPSTTQNSNLRNGLEIQGAEGDGVYIGQADNCGIEIINAGSNGIKMVNVTLDGVAIENALKDGFQINKAGTPSSVVPSTLSNGLEVQGAEGYGVFVGHADNHGIFVNSSTLDGLYIASATDDGATIYGVDKGLIASSEDENNEYGVYTWDKMYAGAGYVGSRINSIGKNTGNQTLEPGDLVVFAGGYEDEALGEKGEIPVINVKKVDKSGSNAIFGVVEYSLKIIEEIEEVKDGETRIERSFKKANSDNAYSGDYVSVVVFGPADVKVGNRGENILTGESLKGSDNAGVRKVRTAIISGIEIAENVGIVGKALENSNGKGMIKVFVNCK